MLYTSNYSMKMPEDGDQLLVSDLDEDFEFIDGKLYTLENTEASAEGAGLMSAEDKSKLDGIEAGATAVTVDTALSNSSENAVQNKVIYTALENKAGTDAATADSAGLMSAADKAGVDAFDTALKDNGYTGGFSDDSMGVSLFVDDIYASSERADLNYSYTSGAVQVGRWADGSAVMRVAGTAAIPETGLSDQNDDVDISGVTGDTAAAILRADYYCDLSHFGDYGRFFNGCYNLYGAAVYYVVEYIAKEG